MTRPQRFAKPIPPATIARILRDARAAGDDRDSPPCAADGWWLIYGIGGALCWLGILWLAGVL